MVGELARTQWEYMMSRPGAWNKEELLPLLRTVADNFVAKFPPKKGGK